MSKALKENEEATTETGLSESQVTESQTDTNETPTEDASEAAEFDAAEWETQYGFEPGALADCKSAEEAIATIAEAADKTILAGLTSKPAAEADGSPFTQTKPDGKDEPGSGKTGNAEIDALKAELNLIKSEIGQSKAAAEQAQLQQLEQRLDREIDKWASPKYGTGKNRNSKQYRQYQGFRDEMRSYVAGKIAMGKAVSNDDLEAIARQVRVFHDDTYKPTAQKLAENQQPLGKPGTSTDMRPGDKQPKNIYEVIQNLK